MVTSDEVLEFWLGPEQERDEPAEETRARWWRKSDALDREISVTFGDAIAAAAAGELDSWTMTAQGRLAVVILLDQYTRNVFRGSGRMYQHDGRAVATALAGIDAGDDLKLRIAECYFLYMPLMHSEDRVLQERCVALFEALAERGRTWCHGAVDYACAHRDIVARFGRFPHRNELLGRASTDEEREFLQEPGSSF
ncbi:MAG: DUF924 domain-containing protein [Myxococcales bacterium]|nr:DUF924 domain-containing protein [Myxococcales bacterium]